MSTVPKFTCDSCLDRRHTRCRGCWCTQCATPTPKKKKKVVATPLEQALQAPKPERVRRVITPEVVAQALALREKGLTWRQVGAELGWDASGLQRAARK